MSDDGKQLGLVFQVPPIAHSVNKEAQSKFKERKQTEEEEQQKTDGGDENKSTGV